MHIASSSYRPRLPLRFAESRLPTSSLPESCMAVVSTIIKIEQPELNSQCETDENGVHQMRRPSLGRHLSALFINHDGGHARYLLLIKDLFLLDSLWIIGFPDHVDELGFNCLRSREQIRRVCIH